MHWTSFLHQIRTSLLPECALAQETHRLAVSMAQRILISNPLKEQPVATTSTQQLCQQKKRCRCYTLKSEKLEVIQNWAQVCLGFSAI